MNLKKLFIFMLLSFAFAKGKAMAQTYFFYSYPLEALRGETVQGTLYKSTFDSQVLVIDEVYDNRPVQFKINSSQWQNVSSPYAKVLEIDGGLIQSSIALSTGNKTLTMRTQNYHIGVTGIGGSWWVSKDEYDLYH